MKAKYTTPCCATMVSKESSRSGIKQQQQQQQQTNKTKTSQPNKNKTNKKVASFGRGLLAGEKRFKRQQSSAPDGVMDRVIGHGRRKGETVFWLHDRGWRRTGSESVGPMEASE